MSKNKNNIANSLINYKHIQTILQESKLFMSLYNHYNNLVLIISSVYFGSQLLMTPIIVENFENHGAFGHIMEHFSREAEIFGFLLIMLSLVKFIGIVFKIKKANIICNILIFALYVMIFFAFLFATPPNIITTLSLIMSLLTFGMILKERN